MDNATTEPLTSSAIDAAADRILDLHAQGHRIVRLVAPPAAGAVAVTRNVWRRLDGATLAARLGRDLARLAGLAGPPCNECEAPPPFRAPHHSASLAALRGSVVRDAVPRPGEITLAHGGVLVLDDAAMVVPHTLETITADLERGEVDLGGLAGAWVYPAAPAITIALLRLDDVLPPCVGIAGAPAVTLGATGRI